MSQMKMKFFQVIKEKTKQTVLFFSFDLEWTFLDKYENITNLKNSKEKSQKGGDPHVPYNRSIWRLQGFYFKRKNIH